MKRGTLVSMIILSIIVSPLARAEGSLTDAELQTIQANCVSAQIALQHVQEADLLTRLNRGYRYDTLLKLMTSLNSRVVQNKLDAPSLITIASDYQKNLDSFRDEFTTYDDSLTAIVHMDCRNEPTTFNDRLVALRSMRTNLYNRIREFDDLLDKYQKGLDDLRSKQGVTR